MTSSAKTPAATSSRLGQRDAPGEPAIAATRARQAPAAATRGAAQRTQARCNGSRDGWNQRSASGEAGGGRAPARVLQRKLRSRATHDRPTFRAPCPPADWQPAVQGRLSSDRISRWLAQLEERIGWQETVVALANKNARIQWALRTRAEVFDFDHAPEPPAA